MARDEALAMRADLRSTVFATSPHAVSRTYGAQESATRLEKLAEMYGVPVQRGVVRALETRYDAHFEHRRHPTVRMDCTHYCAAGKHAANCAEREKQSRQIAKPSLFL